MSFGLKDYLQGVFGCIRIYIVRKGIQRIHREKINVKKKKMKKGSEIQ